MPRNGTPSRRSPSPGRGGVVDAEAAVAEARAPWIEVGERRHHVARAGPIHPLIGRHQGDVADLIADPWVGELLKGHQRVPDRSVGGQPLEQIDRRIAGRDHAPGLRPIDSACRHVSAPRRPGGIQIGAHRRQIGDVAGAHPLQGRLPAEGPVGPLDPLVGQMRIGIERARAPCRYRRRSRCGAAYPSARAQRCRRARHRRCARPARRAARGHPRRSAPRPARWQRSRAARRPGRWPGR